MVIRPRVPPGQMNSGLITIYGIYYYHMDNTGNSGLITKIKGLKTEIYKRVSRVYLSDEDIRAVDLANHSQASTSLRTSDTGRERGRESERERERGGKGRQKEGEGGERGKET